MSFNWIHQFWEISSQKSVWLCRRRAGETVSGKFNCLPEVYLPEDINRLVGLSFRLEEHLLQHPCPEERRPYKNVVDYRGNWETNSQIVHLSPDQYRITKEKDNTRNWKWQYQSWLPACVLVQCLAELTDVFDALTTSNHLKNLPARHRFEGLFKLKKTKANKPTKCRNEYFLERTSYRRRNT